MLEQRIGGVADYAEHWTLADDSQLCSLLEDLNTRIKSQFNEVVQRFQDTECASMRASSQVSNLNNRLALYGNDQFIENKTQIERQEEAVENIKQAVLLGLNMLKEKFKCIDMRPEDFDESDDLTFVPEPIFEPFDPHLARPLPYIIGSSDWLCSPSVGLCEINSKDVEENKEDVVIGLPGTSSSKGSTANVNGLSSSESSKRQSLKGSGCEVAEGSSDDSSVRKGSNKQSTTSQKRPPRRSVTAKLSPEFAAKIGAGPFGAKTSFPPKKMPVFLASRSRGIDSIFTDSDTDDDFLTGSTSIERFAGNIRSIGEQVHQEPSNKSIIEAFPTRLVKDALKQSERKSSDNPANLFSSDSTSDEELNKAPLNAERKQPIKLQRKPPPKEFTNRLAAMIAIRPPGPVKKEPLVRKEESEAEKVKEKEEEEKVDETKTEEICGVEAMKKKTRAPTRRLPARYKAAAARKALAAIPRAPELPPEIAVPSAPELPPEITVAPAPEIPSEITVPPAPEVPSEITVLPSVIAVPPAPEIPSEITVSPAPEIPSEITVSPAPEIPSEVAVPLVSELPSEVTVSVVSEKIPEEAKVEVSEKPKNLEPTGEVLKVSMEKKEASKEVLLDVEEEEFSGLTQEVSEAASEVKTLETEEDSLQDSTENGTFKKVEEDLFEEASANGDYAEKQEVTLQKKSLEDIMVKDERSNGDKIEKVSATEEAEVQATRRRISGLVGEVCAAESSDVAESEKDEKFLQVSQPTLENEEAIYLSASEASGDEEVKEVMKEDIYLEVKEDFSTGSNLQSIEKREAEQSKDFTEMLREDIIQAEKKVARASKSVKKTGVSNKLGRDDRSASLCEETLSDTLSETSEQEEESDDKSLHRLESQFVRDEEPGCPTGARLKVSSESNGPIETDSKSLNTESKNVTEVKQLVDTVKSEEISSSGSVFDDKSRTSNETVIEQKMKSLFSDSDEDDIFQPLSATSVDPLANKVLLASPAETTSEEVLPEQTAKVFDSDNTGDYSEARESLISDTSTSTEFSFVKKPSSNVLFDTDSEDDLFKTVDSKQPEGPVRENIEKSKVANEKETVIVEKESEKQLPLDREKCGTERGENRKSLFEDSDSDSALSK